MSNHSETCRDLFPCKPDERCYIEATSANQADFNTQEVLPPGVKRMPLQVFINFLARFRKDVLPVCERQDDAVSGMDTALAQIKAFYESLTGKTP